MNYRTDLAVELDELLEEARLAAKKRCGADMPAQTATGYLKKQAQIDADISVTSIRIIDEAGEKAFGRPRGTYVTLEVQGIIEERDEIMKRAAGALAEELKKMIPFTYDGKVLVVGLGNEKVTPDSLGPHTVDKVKITRHLFQMFACDGDWEMSCVSGFNPSVTGVTGIETADLIEKVAALVKPDVVIVVDALAAKDIHRVSTTIQISDTGIEPGAGMGNRRREISEKTLGCRVIAIGVPTVIDARTLILDAAAALRSLQADAQTEAAHAGKADALEKYLENESLDMVVTSTDIDQIIHSFSEIIANAINITLHPGIYS